MDGAAEVLEPSLAFGVLPGSETKLSLASHEDRHHCERGDYVASSPENENLLIQQDVARSQQALVSLNATAKAIYSHRAPSRHPPVGEELSKKLTYLLRHCSDVDSDENGWCLIDTLLAQPGLAGCRGEDMDSCPDKFPESGWQATI